MTPTVRNRVLLVAALVVAAAGLGFVAFGNLGENLVYYWTPGEMLAQGDKAYGASIRLGGIVEKGSIHWDEGHTTLLFRVRDSLKDDAKSVEVVSREIPPQMFREGIGVVVEGTFDPSQKFASTRLMVNHSNEYRAPKSGEGPEKDNWKQTVSGGDPQATNR